MTAHGMHSTMSWPAECGGVYVSAAHLTHSVEPSNFWYVPFAHLMQCASLSVAPVPPLPNVPLPHSLHADSPDVSPYCPAAQ